MGYQRAELTVTGQLSRHNDERDDRDNASWKRFVAEVRAIAERHEYDAILLTVSDDT